MLLKNRLYHVLFFIIAFFYGNIASAQKLSSGINVHMDSVIFLNTGLNTLDVGLHNTTHADFKGYIKLSLPNGLLSLGETKMPIHIVAGKNRFLSIKLRSTVLTSLQGQQLIVSLVDEQDQDMVQKTVDIEVPEKRSVVIQDHSELQYLQHVGDSVYMRLRIFNNGTTDEPVRLIFSSPDRLGDREFRSISLSLRSGRDTLVQMGFLVEKYMLHLPRYTVSISGIYANNDVFGNTTLVFPNVSSSRNYSRMYAVDNYLSGYSKNYIDLELDHNIGGTQLYNMRSEGAYRLSDGKLRYSLYASQWSTTWNRPNINNTYIEYERDNKAVVLGNIQENLEAPFYGRGLRFSFQDTVNRNHFSAGIVEKTNDLLGLYNAGSPGMTGFIRLVMADQDVDRQRYEGQVYFDNNKIDSTGSLLWTNMFDLLKPQVADKIQLRGYVGGGVNYAIANQTEPSVAQPSAAVGIKLIGHSTQWAYSSDNFYSTAYYPGNRRGALQLTQRLSRRKGTASYGMGLMYSSYTPEYINTRLTPYHTRQTKIDLTISKPLSSFIGINIQPSYNREGAGYLMQQGLQDLSTTSWQILSSANIRSKNYKHNMFLTVESGVITVDTEDKDHFIFRSNFSYNYGSFGAFGLFQRGAFQVFEILNSQLLDLPFDTRTSFGVSYNGALIQKKLSWNTGLSTSLTSNFGNAYTTNIGANYRITKNTLITGAFRYNYSSGPTGYPYEFANVRLGIRQNLKSQNLDKPSVPTGTFRIFCYYDNNNNEVFDQGDEVATGYGFMVRNIHFVTDHNGRSSFKKIPYGDYMLFLPASKGYRGVSRSVSIHSRSMDIAVPLQKVSSVKGYLWIDFDEKLSVAADLSLDRYTVVARSENGRLFEVRSDRTGEFEFHLPQGRYAVFIRESDLSANIYMEDNLQSITVKENEPIKLQPFRLKVRSKKLEIKRFGRGR